MSGERRSLWLSLFVLIVMFVLVILLVPDEPEESPKAVVDEGVRTPVVTSAIVGKGS